MKLSGTSYHPRLHTPRITQESYLVVSVIVSLHYTLHKSCPANMTGTNPNPLHKRIYLSKWYIFLFRSFWIYVLSSICIWIYVYLPESVCDFFFLKVKYGMLWLILLSHDSFFLSKKMHHGLSSQHGWHTDDVN